MGLDKTLPRFKERNSNSFRKLQKSQNNLQESSKTNLKLNSSARKKTDTPAGKALQNTRQPPSPPLNVEASPKPSDGSEGSAAKPLSLREQIKTLRPINKLPSDEDIEKIAGSVKESFTESEVQELLLSYTYTSGMIDGSGLSAAAIDKRRFLLKSLIRKVWVNTALKTLDSVDKLQSKMYEYFWLGAIYLNVWFPKVTSFFRYVFD